MNHYDIVEWKLFNKDLLDEKIKEDMEDHLLECDHCMETFLSLMEDKLENTAKLSENFTDNVMKEISKKTEIDNENKKLSIIKKAERKKNTYNEFLVYYMAVASVAVFLMGSGFFSTIVSQAPEFGGRIIASKKEVKIDLVYNLSRNITDATSSFVKDFNLDLKEKR